MTARKRGRDDSFKRSEPGDRPPRPYARPIVERWGTIRKLTAGGAGPLPDGGVSTRSTT